MPIGLQTWDAAGNLRLDATTRIGRITATFSTGGANGSISVPSLVAGGEPFFFVEDDSADLTLANPYAYPNVSISGAILSWAYVDFNNPLTGQPVPRRNVSISVGTY